MRHAFIYLLLTGFICGCQQSNHNGDATDSTTAIIDTEKIPAPAKKKAADTFFVKIAGGQPLIIPGKSIGRIAIGQKNDSIPEWLGRPQKGDAGMCKSLGIWLYGDSTEALQKELDIFSECDPADNMRPHVKQIRTTDPAFKTKKGIAVNSDYASIHSVYASLVEAGTFTDKKDQQQMMILDSPQEGIAFEIETENNMPDGNCRGIILHKKGEELSSTYFPFYEDLKMKH